MRKEKWLISKRGELEIWLEFERKGFDEGDNFSEGSFKPKKDAQVSAGYLTQITCSPNIVQQPCLAMSIISIIVDGGNECDNLLFPTNYHDKYDYCIIAQRYFWLRRQDTISQHAMETLALSTRVERYIVEGYRASAY